MAESISEGTLRAWSKQVGDTVEADEEIATIETDKVGPLQRSPRSCDELACPLSRLMSLSTLPFPELLLSSSQRKRTLSLSAKTSSE